MGEISPGPRSIDVSGLDLSLGSKLLPSQIRTEYFSLQLGAFSGIGCVTFKLKKYRTFLSLWVILFV